MSSSSPANRLSEAEQVEVRGLLEKLGAIAAAEFFELSPYAVVNAAAGGVLRNGTRFVIRSKLSEVRRHEAIAS